MNYNSTFSDAVKELQKMGYQEDFILFDDKLFWVQQKIFLSENDFSICNCIRLAHPGGRDEDLVLFCIKTVYTPSNGILINHYDFTKRIAQVIIRKLHEVNLNSLQMKQF